jgi:cell division protein FtsB
MRIFAAILGAALVLLQYRLWISDQGFREVARLQTSVDAQQAANRGQIERNRQLAAEVNNLKTGVTALEERARSELGMVGASETFYQVVARTAPAPAAPAGAVTARTVSARAE